MGNVDAGKSTLIGTLTTSYLDDGRGSSRTAILKHRHEIESGRTSTSSSHLLGFRRSGEPIARCDRIRSNKLKGEDEIARSSYRIVTLMDLAGHEKYLKMTIQGVSSGMADYGLILMNSRHPPTHMMQHHRNLCCSYGIPIMVVFTKVDGCPDHALETSKKELVKLLKSPDIGRRPYAVKTEADASGNCTPWHPPSTYRASPARDSISSVRSYSRFRSVAGTRRRRIVPSNSSSRTSSRTFPVWDRWCRVGVGRRQDGEGPQVEDEEG